MSRRTLTFGFIVAAALAVPAVPALAAGGYGPTTPTGPSNAPGGFTSVARVSTVTAAGGDVSTGIPGGSMAVSAPPGAFPTPVQIEVTTPTLSDVATALPTLGYSAYSAVAGVGIKVLDGNGAAVTGNFAKPLTVTLTGPSLGVAGEKVLEIDGSSKVITLSSATSAGAVTFQIPADPDIVVVNPTVATTSVSHNDSPAGATSVHTGKPFAGEALLAALLIVGGSAVGIRTIRQRG